MATTLGDVQWAALLKELYPEGLPAQILMRQHYLLSRMQKDPDAYGDHIKVPVVFDNPAGRSASIAALLGATGPVGPTKSKAFSVFLVEDYAAAYFNELTVMKASNDRGAFVNAMRFEIDGLLRQLGNSLGHGLYRDGSGTVAKGDGAYSVAGNVITVSNRADMKFIQIGMQIDFVPAAFGAARAVATQRAQVTALDEDAGTITCALDVTGAALTAFSTNYTGVVNTDFIVPIGDYASTFATTTGERIKGLAAWIPLTAPVGGDSFWGVDRSTLPTRLAGHRLNDPTAPAEDSIMALGEVMHERGARPDTCIVSPRQFTKISKRLGAKVEYEGENGQGAKHGFMSFSIATSAGFIPVMADSDCPEDRGYLLTMDTWRLKHLGALPMIVTTDGLSLAASAGSG